MCNSLRKQPIFRDATNSCEMMSDKQVQKFHTDDNDVWVVLHYQYGVSALVSQTSFCGETSGGVAKCWLFAQATCAMWSNFVWP